MKRYNTPHRHRVIKTRLTEEEYAEFSERVTLCQMSQAEFIRQVLTKSRIYPVITVSPVNDELLSAVGKLTAEYRKIGGNLNQIACCLNEYGAPYKVLSKEVRAAIACMRSNLKHGKNQKREDVKSHHYISEEGILLRTNRSIQAEGSFSDLKQDMQFRRYLSKGTSNVLAESTLLAMARKS